MKSYDAMPLKWNIFSSKFYLLSLEFMESYDVTIEMKLLWLNNNA